MAELPGADVEVGAAPERGWVWRCTDASIEKGQVSVLSVLETFWALGLYGVLVWYFGHYWWLLITAFAAPIVLLRSEESVELGVTLLHRYWDRGTYGIPIAEQIVIITLFVISFLLCCWLIQASLFDQQGWISLAIIVPILFTIALILMGAVVGAIVFAGIFASADAEGIALAFIFPLIGLGIWLRILIIRTLATLRYPIPGIKSLFLNWHRINWCLDLTLLPELLPNAGKVDRELSVKGLLRRFSEPNVEDIIIGSVFIPIWYIPALLWRWSLKATLWLWWPLALSLKKPFQTETMPQIRDAIVTIVAGWWKWLLMPIAIIIPWLLSGSFPEISSWVNIMPGQIDKPFDKLVSYAVPAPHSLRYAAIWLVCILSIVVWFKANAMKSQFPAIISDETYIPQLNIEHDEKYSELKQKFYHRAKGIARWHTWRIVSFILLGYSYILYLAYAWYPEQAGRVIPEWLLPYL